MNDKASSAFDLPEAFGPIVGRRFLKSARLKLRRFLSVKRARRMRRSRFDLLMDELNDDMKTVDIRATRKISCVVAV